MEVTIMTGLFAEWDMDVNHGHKYTNTEPTSEFIHIFSSTWEVVFPILLDVFYWRAKPVLCRVDIERIYVLK